MRILVREPMEPLVLKEIKGTTEDFEKIVGGRLEVIPVFEGVYCIMNEDGEGTDGNYYHDDYGVVVGTVAFVSKDGDKFVSLTDKQLQEVCDYIGFPVIEE
ncbi:MAG: DUF3846 domain-containing protein [Clostridiaceae bacterium]